MAPAPPGAIAIGRRVFLLAPPARHRDEFLALGNLRSAYLGYYAGASFIGQGHMSEGLRLVLRRAFGVLRLHRLEANIQPKNHASIRLVRRAGFRREGFSPRYLKILGRWRDHERWAITAEAFRR